MLGHHITGGKIVDAHEVKSAACRERTQVAVEQHHGDPHLSKPIRQPAVHLLLPPDAFKRRQPLETRPHFKFTVSR